MRKKIVAGNWKMNTTQSEASELLNEIEKQLFAMPPNDVVKIVCPPYLYLTETANKARQVKIGAQNCAVESSGAFTGEVSAAMIKSVGVEYVIIGHSERRAMYGETNLLLIKKVGQSLQNNLTPIFCVGETLAERNSGKYFDLVKKQLIESLFHLSEKEFSKTIIAYEPVWAIGTGVTATTVQAQEMHQYIRNVVKEKYGNSISQNISILYGGSCNAQNAKEIFACKDVDGGLIGGASLKVLDFVQIINSF